jgi:hypothetical protein
MNYEKEVKKQIQGTIDFIGIFTPLNASRRLSLANWLRTAFHIMYMVGKYDGIEKAQKIWQEKE